MPPSLLVNEMYRTIEGEGSHAGLPCALVRLAGCNLRCAWCDTTYAYDDGRAMTVDQVLAEVAAMGVRLVLVTGGEPLLQPACAELLHRLCQAGRRVLLRTNGSLDVSGVDPRVVRCVDLKCPGSGAGDSFLWSNLDCLRPGDELKFVLANRTDYDFARGVVARFDMSARCGVVFSPAAGLLAPADLAAWILQDALDVRLGLQLHKVIWPNVDRGV